jgi:ATP-binding cassette subfamily F protein 3
MFLHALAERLIVFTDDAIGIFDGSYQDFLDKGGWGDEIRTPATSSNDDLNAQKPNKRTKKDVRRQRSQIISQRAKLIKPLQTHMAKLESEIETREKELNQLNLSMQYAAQDGDGQRISELSQAIHACQSEINRLFNELENVTEEVDTQLAIFQKQLDNLEHESNAHNF